MVMETPSPQCVGLEFVRQYYTVLNKAPMHLHRFYSNNSLFMHGGPNSVNDPTVGQGDIHKKILSLNFRDCHAKIRMVDAHATLGSGVVIQVTGELSNNGMPMRRFMQTFVLAPQSAKNDDEPADEGNSDAEEEIETSSGIVEENFNSNSATVNGTSHNSHGHHREVDSTSPVTSPSTPSSHIQNPPQITSPPTSTPTIVPTAPVPTTPVSVSVSVTPNSLPVEPKPPTPPLPEADGWGTSSPTEEWQDTPEEPVEQTPKKEVAKSPTHTEPSPPPLASQPASNEPKTYANLFKNTSSFSSNTAPHHQPPNEPSSFPLTNTYHQQPVPNRPTGPPSGPCPGISQSQISGSSNMRVSSRNFHDEERRRPAVPDSQQPIYLNGESRINVEEKKARSRMDSTGGGGVVGGRPGSGGRGGMSGGGGGMRGGQGPMQGGRGGGRGGFNRDNNRGGSRGGGFMQRR
ncbi:Ras GTPase-activating protein-binding protein 2 [Armadillidium vulgare]|nr:Ras GTPase-activating protein-binding protein 2 [Armadillidium vulgare]